MKDKLTTAASIPPRRYLSREEAANWLGISVDTFMTFDIPYCDFGPRNKRWDIVDIQSYAEQNKTCDSARTSQTLRRRQQCDSTNAKTRQIGGLRGVTRMESEFGEVLELPTGS